MKRRNALKNIGLSLGTITFSGAVVSLLQSCQTKAAVTWQPTFFSLDEAEIVTKTLEVILPTTPDIPGATDLNLAQFIDGYLNVVSSEEEKTGFKAGIEQYLSTTLEVTKKSSPADLTDADIEGRLAYYLKADAEQQKVWNKEVRAASKEGGAIPSEDAVNFEVMAYAPVPGEQKGCVDLEETTGGKAWSL